MNTMKNLISTTQAAAPIDSHKKLGLAVVGLGRVAQSHLAAVGQLGDRIELVSVVSRDGEKAIQEAKKWGALRYSTSFEQVLSDPDVEAVLLLLPHDLHASYSVQALRAGKHVLVEKPMALSSADAVEMVRVAEENNVVLMVGQSRRFFKPVMESIRLIRSGSIGDVININAMLLSYMDKPATAWWTDHSKIGGFIIPLWGSHILDYILWAYGELPISVYAQGYSHNPNWSGEDEVAISLKFSGNRMANVWMSFNAGNRPTDEEGLTGKRIWSTQDSIYERYIIGTKGLLRLRDEHELLSGDQVISVDSQKTTNFIWQLAEFVDSIQLRRTPLASGREILPVVQLIDACFLSMEENRVVELGVAHVGTL